MVEVRKPPTAQEPIDDKIKAFVEGSEDGVKNAKQSLDPNAKRDYKAIGIPMNEHEYRELEIGAKLSGRGMINFIRYSFLKESKRLQSKKLK